MAYSDPLAALADPTRRALFERLRRRPHAVGELARALGVTQPAVSQHLKALRRARLVRDQRDGTRRIYRADPQGVRRLREYVEALWDDVLAAYAKSFSGGES
ncbi:MAG TPA: metalloregulator ArsR/SmtB family transcription factor [Gemmatimonadales bacterium]|nr:metalloregulator ArsR/SmtB family transcription factor [Gemmatimonadales bacterium]